MNLENLAMLEQAVERLGSIAGDVVFVGGATVDLWVTDEAAPAFRLTEDIDVVVEVSTIADYYEVEERLREAGFSNDQESGVICRFRYPDSPLVLDVMPTETSILGFPGMWLRDAFSHAVDHALPAGQVIRAIPPPYLLATKLEAFGTRGNNDFYGSRDFGDLVVLIDGRAGLIDEVADSGDELRQYNASQLKEISGHALFHNGLEGALPASPEASERVDQVIRPRIDELISLGGSSSVS